MSKNIKEIKNIIFDFDGVIIDSMEVRVKGINKVFSEYDKEALDKFIEYYRYNAGLSKFIKIKYFYNNILGKDITEEKVNLYSKKLSEIMRLKLSSKSVLIKDTLSFIENNYHIYNFHIASGSEEEELKYLCERLDISRFFKSIHGAPIHKNDLVAKIIKENNYNKDETIVIGDSINDFEAAEINRIDFFWYNNLNLVELASKYIYNYNEIF